MSQYDVLQRRASVGERSLSVRTQQNFHIYIWASDGSTGWQLDAAGAAYYRAHGIQGVWNIYDIGGAGPYVEGPPLGVRGGVDFYWTNANAIALRPYQDIWFIDTESSFYTGKAVDAATDLAGAQNAVSWFKSQWATKTAATPPPLGNYGNSTGTRSVNGVVMGVPYNFTAQHFIDTKNDNDVSGTAVANTWEWMGPELYQNDVTAFCGGLDWLCNEKVRRGITTPLIPFVWRHAQPTTISTYNFMMAQLEYAYSRPECNGLVLWGTEAAAAPPVYYNNSPWMQATLDFTAKYGIVAGSPF